MSFRRLQGWRWTMACWSPGRPSRVRWAYPASCSTRRVLYTPCSTTPCTRTRSVLVIIMVFSSSVDSYAHHRTIPSYHNAASCLVIDLKRISSWRFGKNCAFSYEICNLPGILWGSSKALTELSLWSGPMDVKIIFVQCFCTMYFILPHGKICLTLLWEPGHSLHAINYHLDSLHFIIDHYMEKTEGLFSSPFLVTLFT